MAASTVREPEVRVLIEREVRRRMPAPASQAPEPGRREEPLAGPTIERLAVAVADRLQRMAREERFRAGQLR
jgi:hypothetical protein